MNIIKKFVVIFLATLLMIVTCLAVEATTTPEITVSSTNAYPGDNVQMKISLKNNPGIVAMQFDVQYDKDYLSLTSVTDGGLLNGKAYSDDYTVYPLSLSWNDDLAENDNCANGVVATLTFKVAENAPVGELPITVTYNDSEYWIYNESGANVYFAVVNGTVTVIERPKQDFTGLSLSDATYTYDGMEKSLAVEGTLPAGASIAYENEKATDVGTYNVTATVTADGYNDLVLEATMKINPKNLTVSGLNAESKTYDATTDAVVSGGTLVGKVAGDDVSINGGFPTSGVFANADAGNNIAVSIDELALDGADNGNYTLTQPTLKANITPAPISVKADDITIIKGEAIPELTYKVTSGRLYGDDEFSGALATSANGNTLGNFDITKGTLSAGANYSFDFTKGTLSVVDKTPQNIVVSAITPKTYGDSSFALTVTPDQTSGLSEFTFESSNSAVAEITADGTITIKAAGETNITVRQAGNDEYAPFTKTQKLVVNKVQITVTADAKTKKIGTADPALTYTYTGELVGQDTFTGALERETGETVGRYDIKIGTLKINNNYNITYNKAIFEIVDKTPQNIIVSPIEDKVYGDAAFVLAVTPDQTSGLSEFTFESSNPAVAEISVDGTITIKAAGETNITVCEAGNDDYASFTKTQKLVVCPKEVVISSVDIASQTAVLDGVLATDTEIVLSFDNAKYEILEENAGVALVSVSKLALTGTGAENYKLVSDTTQANASADLFASVVLNGGNCTLTGDGTYLKGASVTVTATPASKYNFTGWYNGDELVSSNVSYTFVITEDIELRAETKEKANTVLNVIVGGFAGSDKVNIKFDTNGGSSVENITVKINTVPEAPVAPEREGFEFDGWFVDKELTEAYDFSEKVTKNLTLYAKWTDLGEDAEDSESSETEKWFADVLPDAWYYDAVKYVYENEFMNGTSLTTFAPDSKLTRAMLVTVLYRLENEPATNRSIPFADIDMGAYYANAVVWAQQNGIVNGVSETEFAPDNNITREQIAAIMFRYAQYKGYDVSSYENTDILVYNDADSISEYAIDAMKYMVGSALISGKTETTLNVKDTATRAETATILQRFIEISK